MNRIDLLNKINTYAARFILEVKGLNATNQYDINLHAETFLVPVLNEIFDLTLENLNTTQRKHFPAIDLADFKNRIAFQVTATNDLEKVKKTLETFFKYGLEKKFDTLYFYIITHKKDKYNDDRLKHIIADGFYFSTSEHILDNDSLFQKINSISSTTKLQSIAAHYEREFTNAPVKEYPKIPEELTPLLKIQVSGNIEDTDIIGRENDILSLREKLCISQKIALIQGMGGVGKTALAQAYLTKYYNAYWHKAWITITGDVITSFISNIDLFHSLNIEKNEKLSPYELFVQIMNALRALENTKPNLLIIDNVDNKLLEKEVLSRLPSPPNWHILVTSRKKMEYFNLFPLGFLKPMDALKLFKKHCSVIKDDNKILKIIRKIDYHTLTIEILAKTAQKRHLNYEQVISALNINSSSGVKISHNNYQPIDKVKSYLCSIFNISKLNKPEKDMLKYISYLPSIPIPYNSLFKLLDLEGTKWNNDFSSTLNILADSGYIQKNEKDDSYKLHCILSEVVRETLNPSLEELTPLIKRISNLLTIGKAKDNPIDKFQWITYANNILYFLGEKRNRELLILKSNLALVNEYLGEYKKAKIVWEHSYATFFSYFGQDRNKTVLSKKY